MIGCGAVEATGLLCFVVINPRVLSVNRVDLGIFLFQNFSNFTPPPPAAAFGAAANEMKSKGIQSAVVAAIRSGSKECADPSWVGGGFIGYL